MSTPAAAIREQLMANDPEYKRLSAEHARYAAQLDQLTSKPYLNEQEQIEEVRQKKQKLRVKDQMERLVQQSQSGN